MRRWFQAGLLLLATGLSVLGYRIYDAATDDGPRVDEQGCIVGDWRAGVYADLRLTLLRRCVTATGIVRDVHRAEDGDVTFDLFLDPGQEWMLNEGNLRRGGGLHIE